MRLAGIAILLFAAESAFAQPVLEMTPEKIKQAMVDSKGEGCYVIKRGVSAWSWGGPVVGCFTTPYSRVVQAAKFAKKRYLPFTEADVTPELLALGEVHVFAYPLAGRGKPNDVIAVVIGPHKGKQAEGVIQPMKATEISAEYKNLMGATFEGRGIMATFPLSVLDESMEFRVVFQEQIENRFQDEEKAQIKLKGVK